MEKYFKSDELNSLLESWLGGHPESCHRLDMERFVRLVVRALELGEFDLQIIEKAYRDMKGTELDDTFSSYVYAIGVTYDVMIER